MLALELAHRGHGGGRARGAAHARAGGLDPRDPCEARGPLAERPRLLAHLLPQPAHALDQVVPAQPLGSVRGRGRGRGRGRVRVTRGRGRVKVRVRVNPHPLTLSLALTS